MRTCIEALAGVLGHTQSLHTNSLDEALALPTDFSARIARNTQLFLQHETGVCRVADPLGGSYCIEALTKELSLKALSHINEIEKLGGMARAIEQGIPKMRIEEAAAKRQARIDSGREVLVGVNKFQQSNEKLPPLLEVDNSKVLEAQLSRLREVRASRINVQVEEALRALTTCAERGEGNLLELAVSAARARATLGEISFALEKVFRRHQDTSRLVTGVYHTNFADSSVIEGVRKLCRDFEVRHGRRPRILVAKLGQDGHDRGAKVIASAFADLGFDVDVGPLFQTPVEVAAQALENDVHIIGISTLAGAHKTLVPELIDELKRLKRASIAVVVGGVIPPEDHSMLHAHGVLAVFGPGTIIPKAAEEILEKIDGYSQVPKRRKTKK